MNTKKKKFKFSPRALSSNKKKKILNITSENSKNVKKENKLENNVQNIENKNLILNTDNNENIKPVLKYLMSANEKEQFDFINTFLKLKGIKKAQTKHKNNSTIDTDNKSINENLINTINGKDKHKKFQKRNLYKREIDKIYNSRTINSNMNNIKEITIDLMDLKSQHQDKKNNNINKKAKSPRIKSYDKKVNMPSKQSENKIFRTKTLKKSPNNNIKIKNIHEYKNTNYNKDIEFKKKKLLEGKHLNLKTQKNFLKFTLHKNNKRNTHTEKSKKLNFPIINELEEDKSDAMNIKVYKTATKNKNNNIKNNETIKSYINNDNDETHEDINKNITKINKINNSIISNEKELASFFSSNTFNNDLVNYKSINKDSNQINNNLNNPNNTNFSIITNSMINNDNNNDANEDKISFQIENNSDSNSNIPIKDIEQNDISDIIILDNKDQIQTKVNINENNQKSENSSQNGESIIEQFDINNNFKQNESKEIKLSQINNDNKDILINSVENNNASKSNINLSITNISKLTNFVDSKLLEISHYSKNPDNNNKTHKNNLPNKNDEINIKRVEHKKVKKIIPKKETSAINIYNNNDNYFEQKLIEKEKEPQDRIKKEVPMDNYRKRIKKLKTTKNSKQNVFEDDDISPTKKLILTNKRDVIYTPIQIVFNNQIEKRNKSKGKTLKGFTLNLDGNKYNFNNNKKFNLKKYYYTSISPDIRKNIDHINQNISIKNNINNNFIINYNN